MTQSPLDALADRIARIGRAESETAVAGSLAHPQDEKRLAAMLDQAIGAMDAVLKRNEDRTAAALDAVAQWMERSEESRGKASSGRRGSDDAAMARTLSLLVGRLEEIDQKINRQPDAAPLREAISRIEGRIDALGKMAPARPSEAMQRSLKDLDDRLNEIVMRLDHSAQRSTPAPAAQMGDIEGKLGVILETLNRQAEAIRAGKAARPGIPFPSRRQASDARRALMQGDLSSALADISSRQKDLDAGSARQRLRALGARLDGRGDMRGGVLDDIKQQIAELSSRLDQRRPEDEASLAGLRSELQSISSALKDATPRRQMSAIESAIERLAEQIAEQREQGLNQRLLVPLERQLADIRAMLESNRDSESLLALAHDIQAMKRRMERLPEQAVDPEVLRDLQSQTTEIRNYVVRSAQKSTGLEALEKRIAGIAEQMEEAAASERGDSALLAEIGARLERLHRSVETAPASSIDLSPLEAMIQKLNGKIDALATSAPSGIETTLQKLEQRLAELKPSSADQDVKTLLQDIAARIEPHGHHAAFSEADLSRVIAALEDKIGTLAIMRPAQSEVETVIRSIEEKLDRMQARVPDLDQFDRMVQDLARQFERAQAPGASDQTFDRLQDQVSRLAARLEQTDEHFSSLGAIERTMSEVFSQIEGVRNTSADLAERAAREAVDGALSRLGPRDTAASDDVERLVRHFDEVKSVQDQAEQRTQTTLQAVHETLETIVERLGMLETELAAERARSRAPSVLMAGSAYPVPELSGAGKPIPASAFVMEGSPSEPPLFASLGTPRIEGGTVAQTPMFAKPSEPPALREAAPAVTDAEPTVFGRANRQPAPASDEIDPASMPMGTEPGLAQELSNSAKELKAAALSSSIDPDLPLEPGAGRPSGAPVSLSDGTENDHLGRMQSARAKFIDAARRAAQAAAEQSADALADTNTDPRTTTESGPKRFGIRGTGQYKKPLLLGIAAIVLAAGGLKLYQSRDVFMKAVEGLPGASDLQKRTAIKPDLEAPAQSAVRASQAPDLAAPPEPIKIVPSSNTGGPTVGSPGSEANPAGAPAARDGQKVSLSPAPGDPISVGAIAHRLPALAQTPSAKPAGQGSIGLTSIGNTPAAELAVESLQLAAEKGDIRSQYDLGLRYIDGRGVQPDVKAAIRWLEKAAANGYAPAQYRLGSLYRDGKGLRNDGKLAYAWFKRAAEQGNARAMHNLAVVLAEGGTGAPDYAGAAEWFRKAAEHGIKDSQFNVAILYARGLGIGQDLVQSYKWFSAAAEQGDQDAARKRDEVAARMSPDKLSEAKAAAQAYRPKPLDPLVNDTDAGAGPKPASTSRAEAREPTRG